ncbi:MAG TPA: hypothetical protein VGR70_07770 [Stellaceae bacterium]|nr:hypothetical protein [Stellaceae bacterium]
MRIAATVLAAIALIGATLTPAIAQNKSAPDEIEGFWVYSVTRAATCRTPAVEKEIGFFTWYIAQEQKRPGGSSDERQFYARINDRIADEG